MGTLEFSVKGLAEELRRRRDSRRGPALLTILLIASLLVLTTSPSPDRSGIAPGSTESDAVSVPPPAEVADPIDVPPPDDGATPPTRTAAQISPGQRNFGSQAVGSSGVSFRFTLTNTGTLRFAPRISLEPANANAFALKEHCATLEPRQRCAVEVAFVAGAARAYSARVEVRDESGRSLATADLSGAGAPESAAAFTANPASLRFPPQPIGTASPTQLVLLQNTRARQFFAGYSTPSGTQFGVLNCAFVRYDKKGSPGESCTINVSFRPTAVGSQSQILEIREMSAPGVPVGNVALARVSLEGTGTSAAVRISPQLLDFSDPNGAPQRIAVQNVGNVAVTINAAPITGGDSNRFTANVSACRAQPLAPNAQCVITVTHRASQQPSDTAELEIFHTAASAAERVRLTWTAPLLPQFSVSPTVLDLGAAQVGGLGRLQVTVTNVGAAPASAMVVGYMFGDQNSFAITNDSCSGRPLAVQGRCTVLLVLQPKKVGSLNTNLAVSDRGAQGLTTFSVTGQGVPPIG